MRYKNIEKIIKGFANHRRIEVMSLLAKTPELSNIEIAEKLNIDFRTTGEHMRKLTLTGLVMKRNEGHSVRYKLTKLGNRALKFCRTLE